jgi:trafficking protein particle complex subunit 3
LIVRLLKDYERIDEINEQLFKMGYNIGIRLVDDFISKGNIATCQTFKETLDNIAKVGFKMYLGVSCDITVYSEKEFGLTFAENPLNDFVELPEKYATLWYSNLLPGIITGGLESVRAN